MLRAYLTREAKTENRRLERSTAWPNCQQPRDTLDMSSRCVSRGQFSWTDILVPRRLSSGRESVRWFSFMHPTCSIEKGSLLRGIPLLLLACHQTPVFTIATIHPLN